MWYLKKLLVAEAVQQSSLHSAPLSSSSSLVGTARLTVSPFRRRRNEEKKAAEVEKSFSSSSSAPAIDPSDASAVAASYTSAGAMNDIERRLGHMAISAVEACGVMKLVNKMRRRMVAVNEVGEIAEKALEAVEQRG
ncbi:uncharacterized protein MONOS_10020 [Monocercomonoides exilis]|uniref:uncharacterized protein n=1 Tax=Monocercomonoides exilis TaxID=2049356 RepID=UPI003559A2DF|nr:hypothetical protein MONOS_10020 [Monocercomonoides exilis]|eukprot:MONOS_10020.1-p1 / transcript=MONOS_10020.1 / gene=MONOS_10020 / organism=Monocercomonoides_exilis_PA203 / gene_product=unspecified product / transcript_product=unspecified product / location=Mono_scaffold00437:38953-39624(-) / protein_length=137 / sequence_SO=supercontig / SO=protein_coding / is_pseudo=false